VTLGCYYTPATDPLGIMVTDGWVQERLNSFVVSKEVAPLPDDAGNLAWECWEEFSERDIQLRSVKRTVKHEQLWSGDVVIWQLAPPGAPTEEVARTAAVAEASPAARETDEDLAPMYPVNNVADLAAHMSNSIDVCVTLHDSHQPLCIDGVVSNGNWGPPRPQSAAIAGKDPSKKDASLPANPAKEERPEDAALALSPASFNPPREMELKMDLRWQVHHVTSTIEQAFGLKPQTGEAQLWLFHAAPGSTYEELLNTHHMRTEQTTLKDLQRTTSYLSAPAKRPLSLHAVEFPFQLGRDVLDREKCPLCLRFFDNAVREVGSEVVAVPSNGTVHDVLLEAKKHLKPEWGMSGTLRVLEVVDSRLHKLYRPDAPLRSMACFSKSNIFYHCLRIEADPESASTGDTQNLMEIFHCDRQSQQAFAQPLLMAVAPGEKSGNIKARCKSKLNVPDTEFKSWRLVRCARTGKAHLKDDEAWDSDPNALDAKLCLEHVHPNPTSGLSRQSRYNKPLTIKS